MNETGIRRLFSQHISGKRYTNVKDVVSWMGALQAQDLNSAKWAIGVRLENIHEPEVDEAINRGEIIRTHLMRPTWHIVSVEDYLPILKLTAPFIIVSLKYRRNDLGLDDSYFIKSKENLERLLLDGNHLTRDELTIELKKVLPDLDSSRMNHILLEAELTGLICSGKVKNKQHSFALTDERLPSGLRNKVFERDEALHLLASKYFKSHGPATLQDFGWWSGLPVTDCRRAIEIAGKVLSSEKVEKITYWFDNSMQEQPDRRHVFLLPAFDEYIISYKDRSAVLAFENHQKTVSSNGVFRPVIVFDGQVIGLWNKTVKKNILVPEITWFIKPPKNILKEIDIAFREYASFLELVTSE